MNGMILKQFWNASQLTFYYRQILELFFPLVFWCFVILRSFFNERHFIIRTSYISEKLKACLMQVQSVVGDSLCDSLITQTLIQCNFNVEQTIDTLVASPRNPDKTSKSFFSAQSNTSSNARFINPNIQTSSIDLDSSKRVLHFNNLQISDPSITKSNNKPSTNKHILKQSEVLPCEGSPNNAAKFSRTATGGVSKESVISNLSERSRFDSGSSGPIQYSNQLSNFSPQVSKAPSNESGPMYDEPVLDEKTKAMLTEECKKPTLSVVVIGHVDAGKSTLVGHLLYKIGYVTKKEISKFEQESKKEGKSSFALAWVMDENASERSRGVTMEISEKYFETDKYYITIVDAPGHKDFIPAMITGAAEADAALLVVDASVNGFESGFNAKNLSSGQTGEHAVLARSLGVANMIVVVNKIDTCCDPKQRMTEIQGILTPFLTKKAGYKPSDIKFLPCSGFYGTNIKEKGNMSWFGGPTLLEAIDSLPSPARGTDQPFCMAITDTVKVSSNNVTVSGVIKSGFVKHNDKVIVQPANISSVLKGIKVLDKAAKGVSSAAAGNAQIAVAGSHIHCVLNIDGASLVPGSFVSAYSNNNPTMLVTNSFYARIITFNSEEILTRGSAVEMHYVTLQEPVYIKKIVSLLDKSGAVSKRNPKFVPKNSSAMVLITVQRNICVQLFKTSKLLGRFMLRLNGATVAAGIIDKISEKSN